MPVTVRADVFWVTPIENADQIGPLLKAQATADADRDWESTTGVGFRLSHTQWSRSKEFFFGTIYRKRGSNLPSELSGTTVRPLDIGPNAQIGEPMCFAYSPSIGVAIVHYSHNGPRSGRVADALYEMGFPSAVEIAPIFTSDALERLENVNLVRKLEYSIKGRQQQQQVQAIGAGVSGALNVLNDLGGVNIQVTVTMGHEPGSLSLANAKRAFRRLSELGDAVGTLRLKGADSADEPLDLIDFVNDRLHMNIAVDDDGREMDKVDCYKRLYGVFLHFRDEIQRQSARG